MDKNRRNFLKVAGISTLAGLGGTAVVDRLVAGSSLAHASAAAGPKVDQTEGSKGHGEQKSLSGNRYGMVIDIKKFQQDPSLGKKIVQKKIKYNKLTVIKNKTINWNHTVNNLLYIYHYLKHQPND